MKPVNVVVSTSSSSPSAALAVPAAKQETVADGEEEKEPWYSWCIAFACFWLSFLTVGLHRSSGIIYVAVVQVFNISREEAIWPFSLCGSLMCLLGPLAGFLTHYFSIRHILVSGVLVSVVAIAACFFTPSLMYLIFFFGALRGIGNGLVVTLNPVLIHMHFTRRKTTASGIAYAGASVGSFALPPLIEYLLITYGFKGCFLVLAAVVLNGLVPAFLARDAPPKIKIPKNRPLAKFLPSLLTRTNNDSPSKAEEGNIPDTNQPLMTLEKPEDNQDKSNEACKDNQQQLTKCNGDKEYHLVSMNHPDADPLPIALPNQTLTLLQKMQQRTDGVFGHFRHTAQILTNPMYLVICVTFGCNVVNFISYLTVIVDFAVDRRVSETDAVILVSAFSVGDLFGSVCLGWISDLRFMKRKYTVTFCFAAMGALLMTLPTCWTNELMLTVSVFMGILNGCVMTNMPVIMREYLGLERLAVAVGLGHFVVGVLQLIFPMLIGYFRDDVGSYDHIFHTMGAMCLLCAFLWILEPLLKRIKP